MLRSSKDPSSLFLKNSGERRKKEDVRESRRGKIQHLQHKKKSGHIITREEKMQIILLF